MKKLSALLIFSLALFVFIKPADASEGVTELRSTNGEAYRCFAVGQQTDLSAYRTLVTCRDLVYPSDAAPIRYIMWANPVAEGPLIKFGKLDFGKKIFEHARAYTSIFVTVENTAVELPKGPIVMQGTTQPISTLDSPISPTPTPEGQFVEEVISEEIAPTDAPSTKKKTSSALKTVSVVIAVILLIGAATALVLIQRSKKR